MSSGGSHDPRQGQDPRYDWLYGDQAGSGEADGANDPTRVMPTSGRGGHPAAPGYPPPGHGGYPGPYAERPYPPPRHPSHGYPHQGYPPPPGRGPYPGQRPPQGPPRPPGARPPGYRPGRPRPIRRTRSVLRTIGILLLAYVAFLIAMPLIAWSRVDRVPFEPRGDRPPDTPGTTYLLVGSDSREGLTAKERRELGTGSASGHRTDTIMLLQVPKVGPPILVSIPRDSYLPIPGYGENRVNAAFAFAGGKPSLLAATLENATGVRIDEYVEIGFGGFVGMVNAVGGVEMCLKEPIEDEQAHIDLPKGCQTLEGKNALGYVRARHFDPRGDFGRVERQQQFLGALADKATSPSTLLNPIRYTRLNLAGGEALTVGESTGVFDMARFALAMRTISGGGGVSLTVPSEPTTRRGMSVVVWDEEDAEALFGAMRQGEPIPADLLPDDEGN